MDRFLLISEGQGRAEVIKRVNPIEALRERADGSDEILQSIHEGESRLFAAHGLELVDRPTIYEEVEIHKGLSPQGADPYWWEYSGEGQTEFPGENPLDRPERCGPHHNHKVDSQS